MHDYAAAALICVALHVIVMQAHGAEIVFGQSASFSGGVWENGIPYRAGILAAFKEANDQGGVNGRLLRLVSIDDQYKAANIPGNVAQLLQQEPSMIGFVGFTGSTPCVVAASIAASKGLPLIGPYTGTADLRVTFNKYVINVRSGYNDEAVAMLKLLVETKRLKRISMIYQNDSFGIPAMNAIVSALSNMQMSLAGLHTYNSANLATEDFTARATEVLSKKPQCIIVYAVAAFSIPFVVSVNSISTTRVLSIAGSWLGDDVLNYMKSLPAGAVSDAVDTLFQTQVMPHPLSTTSNISTKYRRAITAYDGRTTYDYVSLEGYAVGRFAVEALWRARNYTPSGLLDAIYTTKMFELDEMLAGPFSMTCRTNESETSATRSALCNCNQGLRNVWTTAIKSTMFVERSYFSYPITDCASPLEVLRPIVLLGLTHENQTSAAAAFDTIEAALVAASSHSPRVDRAFLAASANDTTSRIEATADETLLLGAIGGMYIMRQSAFPVFPVFAQPALPADAFHRNTIYLLSTLQQEMFVNAKHLARVHNTTQIHLLVRDTYAAQFRSGTGVDVTSMITKSLLTFDRALDGVHSFGSSFPLGSALEGIPASASVIAIGIAHESEMRVMVTHMTKNELLTLYLPFSDLALYWELLEPHDNCETVPRRVVFSTSLPNWLDAASSDWTTSYHSAIGASSRAHPLSAVGFLIARFTDFVLARADGDSDPVTFVDTLYRTSVVALNEMTLGPFVDTQCTDSDCLCNVGPRTVTTFRISDIHSSAKGEASLRFSDCKVTYIVKEDKGVNVALVASLCVVIPVVVGCCIVGWLALRKKGRDHSCAPRDASSPFAVVFTDIESSTALWGRYPAVMAKSIDEHHVIIRACIAKHHMYEVKTIGDSFMVVSKSPDDALRFALDIQLQLYEHDWGTKAIDELYVSSAPGATRKVAMKERTSTHSLTGSKGSNDKGERHVTVQLPNVPSGQNPNGGSALDSDLPPPLPPLPTPPTQPAIVVQHPTQEKNGDEDPYESCWNGLRVRVGVNFGRGEIRFDENTQGYDYYGPVVNEAARVEAVGHGGQILALAEFVSSAVGVDTQLYTVTQLGIQALRGVDHTVTLVQIVAKELEGRKFPALRLDALPKDAMSVFETASQRYTDQNTTTTGSSSTHGGLEGTAEDLASKHSLVAAGLVPAASMKRDLLRFKCVIDGLFAPSPADFRRTTIKMLCESWRVHCQRNLNDTVAYDMALIRLSSRVAETAAVLETMQTLPPEADDDEAADGGASPEEDGGDAFHETPTPKADATASMGEADSSSP